MKFSILAIAAAGIFSVAPCAAECKPGYLYCYGNPAVSDELRQQAAVYIPKWEAYWGHRQVPNLRNTYWLCKHSKRDRSKMILRFKGYCTEGCYRRKLMNDQCLGDPSFQFGNSIA